MFDRINNNSYTVLVLILPNFDINYVKKKHTTNSSQSVYKAQYLFTLKENNLSINDNISYIFSSGIIIIVNTLFINIYT